MGDVCATRLKVSDMLVDERASVKALPSLRALHCAADDQLTHLKSEKPEHTFKCALIGEHTDIQNLLLARGADLLRKGFELIDLTHHSSGPSAGSEDCSPSAASSTEPSMAAQSALALGGGCHVSGGCQPGGSPKRASSVPLDCCPGGSGLPGLQLGRLIGRGSFGRVYRGSWEGRTVAVKVMCHEGSTASLLNALHESLVAEHVQHKNVVATYSVHTIERPCAEGAWCLHRRASLGHSSRLWPALEQPAVHELPTIPSCGYPAGHGDAPSQASLPGPAASTSAALVPPSLTSPSLTSAAVTSPFEVTFQRAVSSGVDESAEPLSQLARRMSLQAELSCQRQRVKPQWRSFSFGEPVPKMAPPAGYGAAEQNTRTCSSDIAGSTLPDDTEEADSIVETLLLMEHADLGSLNRYMVTACFNCNMVALLLCAMDIAAGMAYMHSINLLHGDLKTANVLLKTCAPTEDDPRGFTCKIADFGLSRLLSEGKTHVSTNSHGTIAYVAPEVLQMGSMAMPADVYSYAMLLLELWNGELVYKGVNTHQVLFQVFAGHKPEVPGDMPASYRALMEDCWATDPAARPSFPQILQRLRRMLADARAAPVPRGVEVHTLRRVKGSLPEPSPGSGSAFVCDPSPSYCTHKERPF